MHQGRHRHVSQGLLDLKRLYWNCRVFREGKRKGKSPYDLLGLHLPISDWWQLLQMAPEELEQKLFAQFLVATRGRKVDCLACCIDQTCCAINSILRGGAGR